MLFVRQNNYGYEILNSQIRIHGDGWIYITTELESTFMSMCPNVLITVDGDTATAFTEHTFPSPSPEPEPAADPNTDRDTMIVDHEYRLTLLELGVTK